jgi:hypothetical protein
MSLVDASSHSVTAAATISSFFTPLLPKHRYSIDRSVKLELVSLYESDVSGGATRRV